MSLLGESWKDAEIRYLTEEVNKLKEEKQETEKFNLKVYADMQRFTPRSKDE